MGDIYQFLIRYRISKGLVAITSCFQTRNQQAMFLETTFPLYKLRLCNKCHFDFSIRSVIACNISSKFWLFSLLGLI